jgi:molybdopterin molybdotransferase/putative molybdopterin biosynthesis protein
MPTPERKIFRELQSLESATSTFWNTYRLSEPTVETLSIGEALGRVLAEDVFSNVDVPGFDRAAMDGFAAVAESTFSAEDQRPVKLKVLGEIEAGNAAVYSISKGDALEVATGAPMPKGADSVVMVEYTKRVGDSVEIYRSVTPGENVTGTGSDIMTGELILRKYQMITPREIGLLAAAGIPEIPVYHRPRVAIFSSGSELIKAGDQYAFGRIYDTNGPAVVASVVECGGEPQFLGILPDNYSTVKERITEALEDADVVISSGSTSSGPGDLFYRVVDDLGEPGVLVHGLTLKPGKPAVIGIVRGKPIFGLPGYPTSALMIFHVLVAPIIRRLSNMVESRPDWVDATIPLKFFKARGRRELLPVQLLTAPNGEFIAYPMQSGSGAISSFSMADGFVDLPETQEYMEEGEKVQVQLLGKGLTPPSLVAVGSHCVGLDIAFALLRANDPGFQGRTINVGSVGGFRAVKRGETDFAGVHLQDEETGEYNLPFIPRFQLEKSAFLVRGYDREQGLIIKRGNPKKIRGMEDLLRKDVFFINRNKGSGTRLLIDKHLSKLAVSRGTDLDAMSKGISGYGYEAKTHSAVGAAVKNDRADVGFGIRTVAAVPSLEFIKLDDEKYDFLIPRERMNKKSVIAFVDLLKSKEFSNALQQRAPGLSANQLSGTTIFRP